MQKNDMEGNIILLQRRRINKKGNRMSNCEGKVTKC